MNRGILLKAFRETWPITALFCLGFCAAEGALGFVLPRFQEQFNQQLLQLPFVATFVRALVGADASTQIGPDMFAALAWVHPIALAIVWAHAVVYCTRLPAGEVDRGTIDILLGLPVSRWSLYASEAIIWIASTAAVIAAGILGNRVGGLLAGATIAFPHTLAAAVNLGALDLSVGGVAWLLSSLSDRRGRAVGAAFLFIAASFLLNYLSQFWRPLEFVAPLTVVHYHRPILAMRTGAWALGDIFILLAIAAAAWALGGAVFARRDLATG